MVQPLHSINVNIGENIQKETSQTYIQGKMEQFGDSMRNYIIALYRKEQKWAPNWLKNNRINLKRVSSLEHV